MKESYLYEADDDDKVIGKNDKGDPVTVRQALDSSSDDPTMVKLKKKAQDLKAKDSGEEKPDTKKGMDISKTGGLGGEPEDKPFGGDTGKDADFEKPSGEPEGDEEPSGGQSSVADSRQKAVQSGMALKNAEKEFGKDSSEYGDAKRADDEAQGEYQQAKASQEQRQKDINSGKAEPENKEEADLAASAARDSVEKQKQNRTYALQQPDPRDPRSPAEQEAGWDKTVADAEKRAGEAEAKAKEFGSDDIDPELDLYKKASAQGMTPDQYKSMYGRSGNESIKVINGKKYRAISESVNKRVAVKEVHKWLKGLEEYRYRKVPGVDARRITSFVNNGLNETDLPISLQKKWESAKYNKEKSLADRFIKQRISQKLTQTESKHPLKEQYDRLFKNRVVL